MRINYFKLTATSFLLCFILPLLSACDKSKGVNFYGKSSPEKERGSGKNRSTRSPRLFIVLEEPMAESDLPAPWSLDETLDHMTCEEPPWGTPRHRIELQSSTFIFRNLSMNVTPVSDPDVKTDHGLVINLYIKYDGWSFTALVYQIRRFDFRYSPAASMSYDPLVEIHGELFLRGETLIIPGVGKAVPSVDVTEYSYWPTLKLTLEDKYLISKAGKNICLVSKGKSGYYRLGSHSESVNYCE